MRHLAILLTAGAIVLAGSCIVAADPHQGGIGLHYWFTMDDIDSQNSFDEDGYNWIFSYKYKNSLIGFLGDLEVARQEIAGDDDFVLSPQAFVLIGDFLYCGVGIGIHYADGDFSDLFYALKAGIDMEIIDDFLHLDVSLNYRFDNWDYDAVQDDVDTDTVTLGVTGRIEF